MQHLIRRERAGDERGLQRTDLGRLVQAQLALDGLVGGRVASTETEDDATSLGMDLDVVVAQRPSRRTDSGLGLVCGSTASQVSGSQVCK